MQTILFQGDSITDVCRVRDNDTHGGAFGFGYPLLVSAKLGCAQPDAYRFLNRGVSGDRVVDLYARIKCDLINLRPDVVSILIGVNDVWHEINESNGVAADKFERIYSMLLDEVLQELPRTRFLILEPFITHGRATDAAWEEFSSQISLRAAAAKRAADAFSQTFVPLQQVFDEAQKRAPAEHWTEEGVHPTPFGHALIADEWIKAFDNLK